MSRKHVYDTHAHRWGKVSPNQSLQVGAGGADVQTTSEKRNERYAAVTDAAGSTARVKPNRGYVRGQQRLHMDCYECVSSAVSPYLLRL